jgi:hypothetical protein
MNIKNLLLVPTIVLGFSHFAFADDMQTREPKAVVPADISNLPDLNGLWNGNDGGKYYLKQIGGEVLWYGESSANPPTWSNVAHGTFDGKKLLVRWADVPKGSIANAGLLAITYSNDGVSPPRLTMSYKSGGFGGSYLTKAQ